MACIRKLWHGGREFSTLERNDVISFGSESRNGHILKGIDYVELPDGLAPTQPTSCLCVASEGAGQLRCAGLSVVCFGGVLWRVSRTFSRRIRYETPKVSANRAIRFGDGGGAATAAPDAAFGMSPKIDMDVHAFSTLRRRALHAKACGQFDPARVPGDVGSAAALTVWMYRGVARSKPQGSPCDAS